MTHSSSVAAIEEADERDGTEDVLCRTQFHPYKAVARHTDLVGADVWNGLKGEKKNKSFNKARSRHGGQWVTTAKIYQPDREVRCECPECSRPLAQDVLSGELLKQLSVEVDAAIARLSRKWATPRLTEMTLAEALEFGFRKGVLPSDDFDKIASRRRFLPGLNRNRDAPVAAVLRCAFWIRDLDNVTSGASWTVDDVAERCRALHPNKRLLRRPSNTRDGVRHERDEVLVEPQGRRIISKDDVTAARQVIQHAMKVIVDRQSRKSNRPDGSCETDWAIVTAMLGDGLSARAVAGRVGLGHAMVSRRFAKAIGAIADSLGPLATFSRQNEKLARRVGTRRAQRTHRPSLRTRPAPPPTGRRRPISNR
jgi:hypothetical protein